MDVTRHIKVIRQEGKLLVEAAEQAGLDVDIDTCPGWTMRDLVRHVSEIHLWAAAHVALRATKMWVDDLAELTASWPDLAVFWPTDDELPDHYLRTNANLVRELEGAPADLDAMTFLAAPSPLAMWARRQAHETAIHRFDAQHAAGTPTVFDAEFAADGIDELLTAFAPRATAFPVADTNAMLVHATDTDDRWHVSLRPDGIATVRDDGPADVTLRGRASDVYLVLWNRGDDTVIDVGGDRDLLQTWHDNHRVRWS
jgi:uncharacterized protein (TIGR03083 family)